MSKIGSSYGKRHPNHIKSCHPLRGQRVEVVDVKNRSALNCIGRTGVILHDATFGQDYLSFDDGGSMDPDEAVVEQRPDAGSPAPKTECPRCGSTHPVVRLLIQRACDADWHSVSPVPTPGEVAAVLGEGWDDLGHVGTDDATADGPDKN